MSCGAAEGEGVLDLSLLERPAGLGQNGRMTTPELTPRPAIGGMVATWSFAAVAALAAGLFAPDDQLFAWVAVGAGACVFVAFGANLVSGRAEGFLARTAAAAVGAFFIMGAIALVFFMVAAASLAEL